MLVFTCIIVFSSFYSSCFLGQNSPPLCLLITILTKDIMHHFSREVFLYLLHSTKLVLFSVIPKMLSEHTFTVFYLFSTLFLIVIQYLYPFFLLIWGLHKKQIHFPFGANRALEIYTLHKDNKCLNEETQI